MSRFRVRTSRPTAIGVISNCTDCDWSEEDYQKGTTPARNHARRSGHTVTVEKAVYMEISGPYLCNGR